MKVVLGILGILLFLAYGIAQIYIGFIGIENHFGSFWAWVAVILAMGFPLPLIIGAFYGATEVWGWHWALAAVFAVPGLLLMVPGVIMSIFSFFKRD